MDREEMLKIQRLPRSTGRFYPISSANGSGANRREMVKRAAKKLRALGTDWHPTMAPLTLAERDQARALARADVLER